MQHFLNMLSKIVFRSHALKLHLTLLKLLDEHPNDLRAIELVPRVSSDLVAEVIENLEMSGREDKLHAVVCC